MRSVGYWPQLTSPALILVLVLMSFSFDCESDSDLSTAILVPMRGEGQESQEAIFNLLVIETNSLVSRRRLGLLPILLVTASILKDSTFVLNTGRTAPAKALARDFLQYSDQGPRRADGSPEKRKGSARTTVSMRNRFAAPSVLRLVPWKGW
jgi:hypothetical protein